MRLMGLKTGLSQSVHNAAAQKRRAMEAGIGFAGPAMTGRVKWIKTGAKQMMKVILAQVQQYKAPTLLAPLFIEMENNPKKRYRLYEAAVGLYSGNLLPRLSDNIYFIPSITYYQGLYFRLAGRYIERQTECGEYVYAHKAAKAALAFDPFNSSLNMHLTILLYQQSGAGTANAFYTGIKRHLTEAHIQRIKQTCPNMII